MGELSERLRNEATKDWLLRLKVMFAEAADRIENLEKQVAIVTMPSTAADNDYASLKQERDVLKEKVVHLNAAFKAAWKSYDEKNKMCVALRKQIAESTRERDALKEDKTSPNRYTLNELRQVTVERNCSTQLKKAGVPEIIQQIMHQTVTAFLDHLEKRG